MTLHTSSCLFSYPYRYEDTGDSAFRYSAYVRQRPPAVLFRLLYFWHCWGTALGWSSEESLFFGRWSKGVSDILFSPSLAVLPILHFCQNLWSKWQLPPAVLSFHVIWLWFKHNFIYKQNHQVPSELRSVVRNPCLN